MTIKHKKEHDLLNSDPAEHKMQPPVIWTLRSVLFIFIGAVFGFIAADGIFGAVLFGAVGYCLSYGGIVDISQVILITGAVIGTLIAGFSGLLQGLAAGFVISKIFGHKISSCCNGCNSHCRDKK
ncbi:MAG: hypothetical protein KA998_04835 [Rickettsiaceae bacterium]|nr:hypothetical protein [Rickettsiaceae bacterium]